MSSATNVKSFFDQVQYIPPDAIFALTAQYLDDPHPQKVNLGQGTYRDADGKPWVLPSVNKARETLLAQGLNHEYLPIVGLSTFREATAKLVLGPDLLGELSNKVGRFLISITVHQLTRVLSACNLSESLWNWGVAPGWPAPKSLWYFSSYRVHPFTYLVQPSSGVQLTRLPLREFPVLQP